MSDSYVPPYSLVIKWTGEYDPDATDPDITVTPDPDNPGTYIYSWITHRATMEGTEINGKLDEVWNGISTFTFNVYYGSPCWDCFFPARTAVRLWSEKEEKYIFNGRVADVTEHMGADGILYRTVQCENELAYLCDSICDTKEVEERLAEYNRGMNARDVLVTMLEMHHINAESIAGTLKKGFMPPNSTWNDNTNAYNYPSTCYPAPLITESFNGDVDTTWALIQDILVNNLGMDIWVTYDDSVVPEGGDPTWIFGYNVLNMWYGTSTGTTGDPITISTNMKSLKIETSPTSNGRITRIVPLGGIGVNGRRLDVSSIPQYHEGWTDPSYEKAISNEFLSITYGHIDKVTLHEDLVDNGNKSESEVSAMIQELYRRGKAEADALTGGITSISIEAVDLYEAGVTGAHKFQIGNVHRIVNPFFGLDESFKLVRKVTDLAEPWNPKLEFAKSQTSSTYITKNRQVRTSERIYNVENMISSRLDKSAVKRTTQAAYDLMTSRNPTTVHYADQGDGTWKAYMGDEPIVFSGGGAEVDTAALLDSTNAHHWLADQELMLYLDATTRLLYGGNQRLVSVQGHVCRYGTGVDLYVDDVDNFGSKLELDVWWREDANSAYVQRHMVFEMYVNSTAHDANGDIRWSLGLVVYCYDPSAQPSPLSGQTAEWTQEFTSVMTTIPQPEHGTVQVKTFIVPTVRSMSFADTFSTTWNRVTESVSTPYGYCVANQLQIYYGIWSNGMLQAEPIIINQWRTSGGAISLDACGYNKNPTYKCVPIESLAEKCFDLGLTQRSEPVVPNSGGGGNA